MCVEHRMAEKTMAAEFPDLASAARCFWAVQKAGNIDPFHVRKDVRVNVYGECAERRFTELVTEFGGSLC